MNKPTQKDYDEAAHAMQTYGAWADLAREEMDQLLDKIVDCRERIVTYEAMYTKAKNTVLKYDLYRQIEKETLEKSG